MFDIKQFLPRFIIFNAYFPLLHKDNGMPDTAPTTPLAIARPQHRQVRCHAVAPVIKKIAAGRGTRMHPQNDAVILKTLLALPAMSFAKSPRMDFLHKKERSGTGLLTRRPKYAKIITLPPASLVATRYTTKVAHAHTAPRLRHSFA